MNRFIDKFNISLLCLSLSALCVSAKAQDLEDIYREYYDTWYQVEIIIFERIQQSNPDIEVWSKNISLNYPEQLQFLKTAEDLLLEEEQQNIELSEELGEAPEAENIEAEQTLNASIGELDDLGITPSEQPFITLAAEERSLNREARLLGRGRTMRVLFHEAWRQPLAGQQESFAIPISGGDLFETHFELEGSITLHVARYLHINTNLWLTQFETNYGQDMQHWPMLPRRPKPPQPQPTPDPTEVPSGLETTDAESPMIQREPEINVTDDWQIGSNQGRDSGGLRLNTTETTNFFGDYVSLAERPFVIKQIIKMAQKRRMRSGELHYLDHPRMGLVVKIDQYNPEPPQAQANEG